MRYVKEVKSLINPSKLKFYETSRDLNNSFQFNNDFS